MAHYGVSDSESDSMELDSEEISVEGDIVSLTSDIYNTGETEETSGAAASDTGTSLDGPVEVATQRPAMALSARAYQLEMLEQSLERNIIVAMDTGSGKTQVAVLRIMAELDKCRPDQIVWFLAPTVALASQQLEVLRAQIPAVESKLLCGAHGIDAWSDQQTWDTALLNVRIVVSVYQILFDAVAHAFIRFERLALVVFDEAHNCVKKNAGGRLMSEYYWPAKREGRAIPHILGLTASPVMGSSVQDLETLERTLDAVCKSPNRHRSELMECVNRPDMSTSSYLLGETPSLRSFTESMLSLHTAYRELDITKDPSIIRLRDQNNERSREKLRKAVERLDTYCQRQMKTFCARSVEMLHQLGRWAADYYIARVITEFTRHFFKSKASKPGWADAELQYLFGVLQKVKAVEPPTRDLTIGLSGKVESLIQILQTYEGDPMGIVFAKERATVKVLCHMLANHPQLQGKYRVGSIIGNSQMAGKKQDFLDLGDQDNLLSLQHFRSGRTNLIVATSVLEEGIDVPACNLVVCFERPSNLKSFIQRRGRARMHSSTLHLMLSEGEKKFAQEWSGLEADMRKRYEDDMRHLRKLEAIEESESTTIPPLLGEDLGDGVRARLTIDDAKSRLNHFCATISSRKFVDWNPFYIVRPDEGSSLLRATVLLPMSLPTSLRRIESSRAWRSEENACKDAAFQAYRALYEAGLVNNNLLPLRESDLSKELEGRLSMMVVKRQRNPWIRVASAWGESEDVQLTNVTFSTNNGPQTNFRMALPVRIPKMGKLVLYWDVDTTCTVEFNPAGSSIRVRPGTPLADHTAALIRLAFGHRWSGQDSQHLARFFTVDKDINTHTPIAGPLTAQMLKDELKDYLVRDITNAGHPYVHLGWLPSKPPIASVRHPYRGFDESPEDVPYVVARNWPKAAGFFHPIKPGPAPKSEKPYPWVLPASTLEADSVPAVYAAFGMLIPAITHNLGVHLVASELLDTRLSSIGITDPSLIATAISAGVAREPSNYERLEFLGDAILKLCTTVTCTAQHLDWPEGILSFLKDSIVANSRLCRAAVEFGLDEYIITNGLTLNRWRPTYVDDVLQFAQAPEQTRNMSTKTLADVVEALIGASYVSGGFPAALRCMATMLLDHTWLGLDESRNLLLENAAENAVLPPTMQPLEELIGYSFQRKSLLIEAMTHSSYNIPGTVACLERLEFVGDAILDSIVVTQLFAVTPPLAHSRMHLLRTALVNGDFLGFLAMEWSVKQQRGQIAADTAPPERGRDQEGEHEGKHGSSGGVGVQEVAVPLWAFMRHCSSEMGVAQRATGERHRELREPIAEALRSGASYPWALLARLQAQKYYSDVVESLLAAVWVDSGSMAACEAVLERMGILPYMRRILAEDLHIDHPKEELGRLADTEKVEYLVEGTEAGEEGAREFTCQIVVGQRRFPLVRGGVSREEVRTRAAEEAVRDWYSR